MNKPSDSKHDLQRALQGVVPDSGTPVIEEEILIEIDSSSRDRHSDDRLLARFFGGCVLMIGLITILPAIYYWIVSASEAQVQPVPRWAYIAGFLGAVHVLYGVYIMQLVDYSALQTLSVFLLIVTCLYGFAGMSLVLDDGNGSVGRLLQIPEVLKSRAMIWCGIMFGITALSCYLFGREAMFWHRRCVARTKSGSTI